jgi:hypothetical protein
MPSLPRLLNFMWWRTSKVVNVLSKISLPGTKVVWQSDIIHLLIF